MKIKSKNKIKYDILKRYYEVKVVATYNGSKISFTYLIYLKWWQRTTRKNIMKALEDQEKLYKDLDYTALSYRRLG